MSSGDNEKGLASGTATIGVDMVLARVLVGEFGLLKVESGRENDRSVCTAGRRGSTFLEDILKFLD